MLAQVIVQDHTRDHPSQCVHLRQIGCAPEILRLSLQRAARHDGQRPGTTTAEDARVKALEREVKEVRRAKDILRKASKYFASVVSQRFLEENELNLLEIQICIAGWRRK